ncbi:MAG: stage V sporulation protein AA [Lachnospiraceae bacterium]|nr:stage V sporulation protein AA [Lachnospiraceae bacterium]
MANVVLYIMAKQNVATEKNDIELADVASVYCEDEVVRAKAEALKIHKFKKESSPRVVISIMKVIEEITKQNPGITVESIGETDIIIEKSSFQKDTQNSKKSIGEWIKVLLVALICFFGSGFTIMAYHNDIGISDVFGRIYELVTGEVSDGCTVLEVAYSIGLTMGIIAFYNHVGGKRLSADPTPLEVEMRNYERDVNQAIVEISERTGKEKDVN